MYGLKYIIEFKTLKNNLCRVELLKKDYKGVVIPLQGMATPFVVEYEDEEFLYAPVRKSSCKINIYANNYLQDLFSTNYQDWKIVAYYNDTILWAGFISPEVYTQDYSSHKFEFNIEGVSGIAVLENIEYDITSTEYITVLQLLNTVFSKTNIDYTAYYIPQVYSRDLDSVANTNILQELQLNPANFIDEDGDPMMYLEVLEEIMKYLNWTCIEYNGAIYFVDIDHNGPYRKYNSLENNDFELVNNKTFSVQNIGFAGGDQKLDILGGYSKASVKVNNYNVVDIVKNIDYEELSFIKTERSSYEGVNYTSWQLLSDAFGWHTYKYNYDGSLITEEEWINLNDSKELLIDSLFSCLANSFSYGRGMGNYDKSKYSYTNCIAVRTKTAKPPFLRDNTDITLYTLKPTDPVFSAKYDKTLLYAQGALCIDFKVSALTYRYTPNSVNAAVVLKTNGISHITCVVKIGEWYWNGTKWGKAKSTVDIPLNNDSDTSPMQIETNKKLFEGPNDADGYVIDLWSRNAPTNIIGDLEVTILASTDKYTRDNIAGYNLENMSVKFIAYKEAYNRPINPLPYGVKNSDRIYENVVNGNFINALDEIEFKINSYEPVDGISLSKPLLDNKYVTTFYNSLLNKEIRQEELLIQRIINQYANPKYKFTQQLNLTTISPIDCLTDKFITGVYTPCAYLINPYDELVEIKAIENERG